MPEIDLTYGCVTRELDHAIGTGAASAVGRSIAEGMLERLAEQSPLKLAVRALNLDWHDRSTRPCSTCSAVSAALGEPFGCDAYRLKRQQQEEERRRG